MKHEEKHHISSDDEEKIDVVETTSVSDEDNLASAASSSHIAPYRSVGLVLPGKLIRESCTLLKMNVAFHTCHFSLYFFMLFFHT